MKRRAFLAGSALAPFASGCSREKSAAAKAASLPGPRAGYFPNVALLTHENEKVRFYEDLIRGKIVTVNFILTRCPDGLCPLITANLVQVQRLLGERVGRDICMYTITLDPEHDTPAVLKAYAKTMGVKPGWRFLTGRPEDIELLRRKLGFFDLDPIVDQDKENHSGVVLFGNEPRDWWAATPGLSRPAWIVEKILWVVSRMEYGTRGRMHHADPWRTTWSRSATA